MTISPHKTTLIIKIRLHQGIEAFQRNKRSTSLQDEAIVLEILFTRVLQDKFSSINAKRFRYIDSLLKLQNDSSRAELDKTLQIYRFRRQHALQSYHH